MDDTPATLTESKPAAERPLTDDLRQLLDDGRRLAEAELAYQKSRALYVGSQAKGIALLVVLALSLAFFALMALTIGLVIGLAPTLGALGATAAVVGGLVLIALLCALIGVSRWRGMNRVLKQHEGEQ
jgi:uncharacterized membrane protein YqjE